MIVFSCEGVRHIDPADIVACYAEARVGGWCDVTLCLFDGKEVSGRASADAVAALRDKLDDFGPPPLAA
jgi:hypothetical protein